MRLISNNKNKLSILLLTLIPIPFFYRAYTKFFNDEFREYWSIYYENSSASLVKLFSTILCLSETLMILVFFAITVINYLHRGVINV